VQSFEVGTSHFNHSYYFQINGVKAFKKFDALISPTLPILPPKFSDIEKLSPLQNYMMDIMTVSPNLAGLPHLSVPVGFANKLPVGMLLTGDHLQENKLIQLGKIFENEMNFCCYYCDKDFKYVIRPPNEVCKCKKP